MVAALIKRVVRSSVRYFGLELSRYCPQADKWLAQKALLQAQHAPIILDIGANVGQTLEAYKALFPESEIHSVEPFPDSFLALQQVASRYSGTHIYQLAMAEQPGEHALYVNQVYHATNSLLPRPASGHCYYPEGARLDDRITVKTNTLDLLAQQTGLGYIDILKMDIQGGELAALRGATGLLEKQSIGLIITEVMFVPHYEGGAMFNEIHDFMLQMDYSLFGIYDLHYAENGQIRYADAIFISRDLRSRLK